MGREHRPRRTVFYVNLVAVIIGVIGALLSALLSLSIEPMMNRVALHPTPTPMGIKSSLPSLEDQLLSSLRVATENPPTMEIDHSYFVRASLLSKDQQVISSLAIENAVASQSGVTPIGTSGATLKTLFGPEYTLVAKATLAPDTGPFNIQPVDLQTEQVLDQPEVKWTWSVVPRQAGTNYLLASITVFWKTANGTVHHSYTIGEKIMRVTVIGPTPTQAPITLHPTQKPTFISVEPVKIDIGKILVSLLPYIFGTAVAGGGAFGVLWAWFKKRSGRKKAKDPILESHTEEKKK